MKFNWKSKNFVTALVTVACIGFGVANPQVVGSAAGSFTCAVVVKCDA